MLLMLSKLFSKFEKLTPSAESPFSQQRRRILENFETSSTCSSLLAVVSAMVVKVLGIIIAPLGLPGENFFT